MDRHAERGATVVEYAVIVALLIMGVAGTVSATGGALSSAFCSVGSSLVAGGQSCAGTLPAGQEEASPTATPEVSELPSAEETPPPVVEEPTPTPTPTPTIEVPANSPGTMVFNTATVDQDQILSCLSARVNVSWYPSSWSDVAWPQSMTVDVRWTPALEVYAVYPGTNGSWTSTLVEPGHLQLTRTGPFTSSGFQPEPEILLRKPAYRQDVSVTFTASAPNTPSISRAATTAAWPY